MLTAMTGWALSGEPDDLYKVGLSSRRVLLRLCGRNLMVGLASAAPGRGGPGGARSTAYRRLRLEEHVRRTRPDLPPPPFCTPQKSASAGPDATDRALLPGRGASGPVLRPRGTPTEKLRQATAASSTPRRST